MPGIRSLQGSVLAVVGGSAIVAMVTIGGVYAATEVQHQAIEADASTAIALQGLASRLSVAVRDEEPSMTT